MPRMPGRFPLALVVAGAALAAPAAASAATFTVDQGAPPGCAANICKTIAAANGAAADGDTISITATKTPYVEVPIVVTKKNLVFEAQPGGAIVTSNGAAGTSVFTIGDDTAGNGDGTTVRNLLVAGQENGGPAIVVGAKGVTLDALFVARATANSQDAPAVLIDDTSTAITTIRSCFVLNAPTGTGAQIAPAIQGGPNSSLLLQDTSVLSGAKQGPAVALPGNELTDADDTKPVANQIVRSTLYANQADKDALSVTSAATSTRDKLVNVDSSILSGGADAAGLAVTSAEDGAPLVSSATSGDLTVNLLHTTIAGSAKGIVATAAADGPAVPSPEAAGSIDINVDRSIVKGTVTGTNTDSAPTTAGNTVAIEVKDSDSAATASDGSGVTIVATGNQNTTPEALFVNPASENFHLRHGSSAIDKAGAQVAGASDKDVDGDPRVTGASTDLGGDEFVNRAPVPVLTSNKRDYAVGEVATFDGSRSVDPDQGPGSGVTKYVFAFGDGTPNVESATPSVQHTFAAAGTYRVRLGVADAQGVVSTTLASTTVNVSVTDDAAPVVKVTSPKAKQILKLFRIKTTTIKRKGKQPLKRRTRIARKIRFAGTAEDPSGIGGVAIALRRVKLASRTGRSSQSGKCRFFDFRANVVKVLPCRKPRYLDLGVKGNAWSYRLKKKALPRLRAGSYELLVRATDKTGKRSDPVRVAFRIRIS